MGANATSPLGSPIETLRFALTRLASKLESSPIASGFYRTPAFPRGRDPDFVNLAAAFETNVQPIGVLESLHEIEEAAGRVRGVRWGARTLDLDLLAYGNQVLPSHDAFTHWANLPLDAQMKSAPEQLILPHPRLQDRSFVLVPLAEIAPDWVHPVLGKSVVDMRDARPADERAEVVLLGET